MVDAHRLLEPGGRGLERHDLARGARHRVHAAVDVHGERGHGAHLWRSAWLRPRARPGRRCRWRVSTRCAQTLPLLGSTIATVPPRRSAVRGTKMSRLVAAAGPGTATADACRTARCGGRWARAGRSATESRRRRCRPGATSRGESLVVSALTPASNWPAALFSRAKLASAAEETHTPPSLRSASCTVSPLDCTAKRVRLEAATRDRQRRGNPHLPVRYRTHQLLPLRCSSQAATSSSARSASVTSRVDSACSTSRALRLLASFPGPPCSPRVPASASF